MPIYEYECECCHEVYEEIFSIIDTPSQITCPKSSCCDNMGLPSWANKIFSRFNTNIEAKGTKYFYNPNTGEKQLAINSNQKAPFGFVEKELKGSIERSKFEKEEQKKRDVEYELDVRKMQSAKDETRKNRQDDINSNLTNLASKADNPSMVKSLMKDAMNRSKNKKLPKKRKDVMFQVNHTDKSNMD